MKLPALNFPMLPTAYAKKIEQIRRMPKEKFAHLLIKDIMIMVTTDNPKNLDVKTDANKNMEKKFLGLQICYKVEVEEPTAGNKTYLVKLYMHSPIHMKIFASQYGKLFYDMLYNEKSLKTKYPDRRVSWEFIEEEKKGEKDAEKKVG